MEDSKELIRKSGLMKLKNSGGRGMKEFNIGSWVIQMSDPALLAIFWVFAVGIAFNLAYCLFLKDRGRSNITGARIAMTIIIGTLIVLGTYADILSKKPFALRDCLILALVAAHGWVAEDLVQKVLKKASKGLPT